MNKNTKREIFMKLFNFSINTYYKWKREKVQVIKLIEKYFTQEELEEFLETGEISSFSKIPSFAANRLEKLEQKQREQDEAITQLKDELTRLHLRFDEKNLHYDKAGHPKPSGNPRK